MPRSRWRSSKRLIPIEDVAQDERRPRLAGDGEAAGDRARHRGEVGSLHDVAAYLSSLRELTLIRCRRWSYRRSSTPDEWQQANEALLSKEKAATRERDALAAERRRQPMMEFSAGYEFEGPGRRGHASRPVRGTPQLIVYHFWLPPDGDPCGGCSMFADQVSELGSPARARHHASRSCRARRRTEIEALKRRHRLGAAVVHGGRRGVPARLRHERVLRAATCSCATGIALPHLRTRSRGVEALGSVWTFLDLTPFGRQEEWEDTPPGRPQSPPYQWWRLHDAYA